MTDTCRASYADMNADCDAAVAGRLSILLTGSESTVDDWIRYMYPGLALPVIEVACEAGIKKTALNDAGTVVLRDVERLRRADQQRLLRWLEKTPRRPQVISTSSRPVFPLVVAGGFSEGLYYRLNTVHLDCTNTSIIHVGASSDEVGWTGEFPTEERVQAAVYSAPSGLLALLPTGRIRLALTSCAFGVVIGALSMWVVTAQSQLVVVPISSGIRIQEVSAQPAPPRQDDLPVPSVQGLSQASALSLRTAIGQSQAVEVVPALQQPAARPRRTVFRGALAVDSRPAGARVSINGRPLGVTPLMVRSLPVGSRVVRLTAQGYHPWSSAVRVVANQRNSVNVTMQRLPD